MLLARTFALCATVSGPPRSAATLPGPADDPAHPVPGERPDRQRDVRCDHHVAGTGVHVPVGVHPLGVLPDHDQVHVAAPRHRADHAHRPDVRPQVGTDPQGRRRVLLGPRLGRVGRVVVRPEDPAVQPGDGGPGPVRQDLPGLQVNAS
jgi:hypothetical protein